jgi:hypothetical protein
MGPCTVVSVLPYKLDENKPVSRGSFQMPAVARGDVAVLLVDLYYTRNFYVDHDRGNIDLVVPPEEVAASIANDHIRATIHTTEGARPGIFYVRGNFTSAEIRTKFPAELKKAMTEQDNWFKRLVKVADDTWQRYRRHNMISDQHRDAARSLGLKREWADEMKPENTVQCVYCTSIISQDALVCPVCRLPQAAAIARLPKEAQAVVAKTLGVVMTAPTVGG